MSVEFKNLAQAELCAALEVLLQNEDTVREAAVNGATDVTLVETYLYLGAGLCHYIQSNCDIDVAYELRKLNEIYAGLNGTDHHYPVPAPDGYRPERGEYTYTPDAGASEQIFDHSSRREMWGEGEYAQSRWDYIRWLVDYMKNQQCIKEL